MSEDERYYVGKNPPEVEHVVEKSRWARKQELELEDGDHLRLDEQGYDDIHEQEETDVA